jgi:hypothetical protein
MVMLAVSLTWRGSVRTDDAAGGRVPAGPVATADGSRNLAGEPGGQPDVEPADAGWSLLLAVADETPLTEEEALALPARPGQAELAAGHLTAEERAALVALLNEAIAAPAGRRES